MQVADRTYSTQTREEAGLAAMDSEDMSKGPASKLRRSSEFWYQDGTIIFVAQDTAFRIYRGLLAQHSIVFRGLFMVPQPEDAEQIDGCLVVRISDHPRDFEYMLRFLAGLSPGG